MRKREAVLPNITAVREVAKRETVCKVCLRTIKPGAERVTFHTTASYPRSACIPCVKKAVKKLGLLG